MVTFQRDLLLLLIFSHHLLCHSPNEFVKYTTPGDEDIWESLSDFTPIQSAPYGTIRLGQLMSIEMDFIFHGRSNIPRRMYRENFFRVGHDAHKGERCKGQGSRYPSMWLSTGLGNTGYLDVSTSSGLYCSPQFYLMDYGYLNLSVSHHIKIVLDHSSVSVTITGGGKPDYSAIFDRAATDPMYIGDTVAVWWMSNKFSGTDYNVGNATFSNVILKSKYFTTNAPTKKPSFAPTKYTSMPTTNPTPIPTQFPIKKPTDTPTISPTIKQTYNPTLFPTLKPTYNPINTPTLKPTTKPTNDPTLRPTSAPTHTPTENPSLKPTYSTAQIPTLQIPTMEPTKNPTMSPTNIPTLKPSEHPSSKPTYNPNKSPTYIPTLIPSIPTSYIPSPMFPTYKPTQTPSKSRLKPSLIAQILPTNKPTKSPTKKPTLMKIPQQKDVYTGHGEGNMIFGENYEWFWGALTVITISMVWMIGILVFCIRRIKKFNLEHLREMEERREAYVD